MEKEKLCTCLVELYNNNKLRAEDECTILNTLDYLGFDIRTI